MKDVSSIIKVSSSKSLSSSLRYVTSQKPKDNDNGRIKNRVLDIKTMNLFDNNLPLDYKIMRHQLYASGMNGKVHCVRLINSFRGLKFYKPQDVKLAQKLNSELLHKAYGNNVFCVSVWQADNKGVHSKGNILHCHNILLNSDAFGNNVTTRSRFYRLAKINHKILKEHHLGYYGLNHQHTYHSFNPKEISANIHHHLSHIKHIKPVIHSQHGRIYFPKIFHGKSIISVLRSSANKLKHPTDFTLAQNYLKRSDNREDVKAVKLKLIDERIDTIKARIAQRNEIRQIRINELKRRRGLSR